MDIIQTMMTALFTGIGTAAGLYCFEKYLKPHIEITRDKFKSIKDNLKEYGNL